MENKKTIGFIPMELEEKIMSIAKFNYVKFNDVLSLLNALVDSKVTMQDLEVTPSKSGTAYQNKLDKKTKDIWKVIEKKYKGNLIGNGYYSSLKQIIVFKILKEYKPFRKFQKK